MKMPSHFYFQIVHEDLPKRRMQSRALHAMAALLILVYGIQYLLKPQVDWWQLLAIIPPAFLLLWLIVFKRKMFDEPATNRIFRILEMGFLAMGSMHFMQKNVWIPAIFYLFFCVILILILKLESRIFSPQYLDFEDKRIVIDFPLKTSCITWDKLERITLKNHYLTFHLKNGKYREFRIKDQFLPEERSTFDHMCKHRIGLTTNSH